MPAWKKDLQPSPPFPPQLSPQLQKGPSPFLSIKRNTIPIGEAQVWLEPGGTNTPPLRWYRKSSADFGVSCCESGPLELWPHAWEYDKLFIMCLYCNFFPEFISSYNIWRQCLHGSVVLSLITNGMAISSRWAWPAHALPEEAWALYSSPWLQVVWYL